MYIINIRSKLAKFIEIWDHSPHYLNAIYEFYSNHKDYCVWCDR